MSTPHSNLLLQQPQLTQAYLARVALDASEDHLAQLQAAVDAVEQQAQNGAELAPAAIEFVVALLDNPWWGGLQLGYNHAQQVFGQQMAKPVADIKQPYWAQMQQHFMHGGGETFVANRQLFQASMIVREIIDAMKQHIKQQQQHNRAFQLTATSANDFLLSPFAQDIEKPRLSADNLGYLFSDGSVVMEQKEPRYNRVFDRFILAAYSNQQGAQTMTRWRIEGGYSFREAAQQQGRTGLVLTENQVLTVPFLFGQLLVGRNLAHDFCYFTEWMEWY